MNIYISNLGDRITDESLRAVFATHGKVSSSKVIMDERTGFSKSVAFIEMPNIAEATTAISKINGCIIDGCAIAVKEANLYQ